MPFTKDRTLTRWWTDWWVPFWSYWVASIVRGKLMSLELRRESQKTVETFHKLPIFKWSFTPRVVNEPAQQRCIVWEGKGRDATGRNTTETAAWEIWGEAGKGSIRKNNEDMCVRGKEWATVSTDVEVRWDKEWCMPIGFEYLEEIADLRSSPVRGSVGRRLDYSGWRIKRQCEVNIMLFALQKYNWDWKERIYIYKRMHGWRKDFLTTEIAYYYTEGARVQGGMRKAGNNWWTERKNNRF